MLLSQYTAVQPSTAVCEHYVVRADVLLCGTYWYPGAV